MKFREDCNIWDYINCILGAEVMPLAVFKWHLKENIQEICAYFQSIWKYKKAGKKKQEVCDKDGKNLT